MKAQEFKELYRERLIAALTMSKTVYHPIYTAAHRRVNNVRDPFRRLAVVLMAYTRMGMASV